jgi:hypothetical protein
MKLPSLKSSPKPDAARYYKTCAGFCVDVPPDRPSWAPRIGTVLKGTDPGLVYMYSIGASRYFLPADADDVEFGAASAQATFGALGGPEYERPVLTPEPALRLMISTRLIQIGEQGIVPAGSLASADSALVKRFPDAWQPAPDGYGE